MSAQAWGEATILVICIFAAALASGTETALTSVSRLRVRHLAEEGSPKAATLQRLQQDPNRFLGTVLVVNTFALILASASATLLSLQLIHPVVPHALGTLTDFVVSLLLSVFLLIFAEVTPKTLAVRHADRVALQVAPIVDALATVFSPILWFVTAVSRAVIPGAQPRPYVTEAELMTLLHVSEEQGVIEEEEREMIDSIIEIGDMLVREVMVPRTDVIAVDKSASLEEIQRLIAAHGHTRLPVYEKDIDHIIGLIHVKDLLRFYAHGGRDFQILKALRPIRQVPEQKKVDELLHEMRTYRAHMMVVVDEYGGTAGIVTLEDVLEEIVGEIRDEYDQAEKEPIQFVSQTEVLVDGSYPIDELCDKLGLRLGESEEYDSVGGYVNSVLGEIPKPGATFEADGSTWTVEAMDGQRVRQVRIQSSEPWPVDTLLDVGLIKREEARDHLQNLERERSEEQA